MTNLYHLEFVLCVQDVLLGDIESSLSGLGESLELVECVSNDGTGKDIKIRINTIDPTIIFDTCAQFGRLKAVKVDEVSKDRLL